MKAAKKTVGPGPPTPTRAKGGYSDAYLDALIAKPVADEWTDAEKAALPDVLERMEALREAERATAEDLREMTEGAGGVICAPGEYFKFVSSSLPQKYPYHEQMGGTFDPETGACRFNNRREVERTLDHARANGEKLVYPGRGGVNREPL